MILMLIRRLFLTLALCVITMGGQFSMADVTNKVEPVRRYAAFETEDGIFTIMVRPDLAPIHSANFLKLVADGFYNGLYWHRVVPDFVAQTGDPTQVGRPDVQMNPLPLEINSLSHERGAVGMARLPHDKNSARTQFYIVLKDAYHLDGDYTVFGEVSSGMRVVDKIKKGDKIIKAYWVDGPTVEKHFNTQ